ncbi:MarR family transcriptional regulator [Nocardioides sp.]|uniref:MarR family winged helix-turn-helix transcriptional regulator n=1 Tax=Nocardioides sp. TaxID=35761 RepID=UPI002627D2E7|nr:MarR family transcriptional regulator [Nocardioides sp.]
MHSTHTESTGDLLMVAARMLRRRFSVALEEYDVTPSQSRALRTVAEEPGVRLSVIAERLRIAPRSATDVIDALERRGLVQRQPDPVDRRATCVVLTQEGARLRALIDAARHRELDGFASHLSDPDRAELDRILRQVVADLRESGE